MSKADRLLKGYFADERRILDGPPARRGPGVLARAARAAVLILVLGAGLAAPRIREDRTPRWDLSAAARTLGEALFSYRNESEVR